MTDTEEDRDYIGICIDFGCDIDVLESTFTSSYWGVAVNDGLMKKLNEYGVTYEDVVEVIKSTLGESNLSKAAHDVTEYYVNKVNSKMIVLFDLGDTKLVDGKASISIVQLQHGLLKGGKWGVGTTDVEFDPILKGIITEDKLTDMHESLKKNIFSKIPGAVIGIEVKQ